MAASEGSAADLAARERRVELLIRRLPSSFQPRIRWLRSPAGRWVRAVAGVLFIAGSFLAILPVFGLWMLPLGLALLAEDVPPLQRLRDRILLWIEQRRPHWLGLACAPRR